MPEVIGQDESQSRQESCDNCGAILKYYKKEMQEDYSTDYTGGKDYYNYIMCPRCNERVIVERW